MDAAKKKELIRSLKFLLISASAGIIQVGSFTLINLLIKSNAEYGVSYFISLILSVLWNFTINRKYTFQSASNITVAMLLVFAFYVVFTPLSVWWGIALEKAGWNDFLILALTMIANFVLEFLFTRFVVYRNSVDTNARALAQAEKETTSDKTENSWEE